MLNGKVSFFNTVQCNAFKDENGMENSVDPDQTASLTPLSQYVDFYGKSEPRIGRKNKTKHVILQKSQG